MHTAVNGLPSAKALLNTNRFNFVLAIQVYPNAGQGVALTRNDTDQDARARVAELEAELRRERARADAAQTHAVELESELKVARAQFALAERAMRVGFWRFSLKDGRKTWSPGLYALLGLEPGAPIPELGLLIPKDEGGVAYLEKRSAAIENRSSYFIRNRIRCADGLERVIDTFGEPELGTSGEVVALVGASQDVTQRVMVESERDRVQELYRIMTEAASDIITVYRLNNGKGRTEYASAALGRMLGWSLRNLEGDEFFKHVHPDDIAEAEKLGEIPASGKSVTATYRVRHADGHYVWIEGTFNTVFDEETGRVLYRVGVARDVSERKSYEEAVQAARLSAETANRAKSVFLANMSHELRTPLNAIIGFADVMNREMFGPIDNSRYRNYLASIHKSGEHLLDLINDILDVAKIEAGKLELRLENVNLTEVIGECIQLMSERAASAGVQLKAGLPAQGIIFMADARAVKQVVLNLLSNAIKFTPAGGHVDIAVMHGADVVRLEVRDDGIGIAAEDIPRLAKPFEQVCDDPGLAKRGTGLGLALVRALTELHGGRVTIDSPARKGTIVTVELPLRTANYETAA